MDLKITFIILMPLLGVVLCSKDPEKPNIVIMFADDLGYGDLQAYGHPTSHTPNLNNLAKNGLLFTQFYVSSPVCSPSRASLLTGRYQTRSGIWPGVFEPDVVGGLPLNETTVAEILHPRGYHTAIVGKWHLGVGKDNMYLPPNQGFDEYYGIPYSHDMCPCEICFYPNETCLNDCKDDFTSCPVFDGLNIVEQPADLVTLHEKYVNRSVHIIADNAARGQPFFLYYAFQHTHHPKYAGKQFRNSTIRGPFGDALAELDDGVGRVMKQLEDSGVLENTLVLFTSDNGPSLRWENIGGNAGLLKCGKGTTYEGGQRVPAIASWKGRITPGRTVELTSALDILPTICSIVGVPLPSVTMDGVDISSVLFNGGKSPRESFFYYPTTVRPEYGIYAVRYKQYKAHYYTQGSANSDENNHDKDCRPSTKRAAHDPPLLYDLHQDPSEQYDLSNDTNYASIIDQINQVKAKFEETMVFGDSQMANHSPYVEPCCNGPCDPFPECCKCTQSEKKDIHLRFIP
ncbi:arylsulfatase A-like [Apostichopus japonicus]|uniref:arylsulfatase A-like n=1 Tax=Stichopus japonicus TaxID=307972 RepID=UPI003AB69575